MEGKRLWVRRIAALSMLLLLLGTLLSFVIAPRIQDARTREMLGDPDAYVTDTKRSPWITVDETGMATLYTENMVGMTEIVIPDAVNGVKVTGMLTVSPNKRPRQVKIVVFPGGFSSHKYHTVDFSEWESLETLVFSEGVSDLSKFDVRRMPKLRAIYFPSTLSAILPYMVRYCEQPVTVYYAGTEEQWEALGENVASLSERCTVVCNTPVPEY